MNNNVDCIVNEGVINKGVINTYPCIKERSVGDVRVVVLFTDDNAGTVIECTDTCLYCVGDYCQGWDESNFKLFGGTIELRNN